jgi:dTDP-glucose 4,6-dehydratase
MVVQKHNNVFSENKTILVTGAAGFFGSHMVEEILVNTSWNVVALCRLSSIGDMDRLMDSNHVQNNKHRIKFIYHDLKFDIPSYTIDNIGYVDYVAHLAANSHVDRSITHPKQFFEDNVIGTINLLEWYRLNNPSAIFINYLTDEVFGPAPNNYNFKEDDRWRPSNPYSGSKCGQGAAGICYHVTYSLPIINTYTMNMFGERQNKEKLIAKSIYNIKNNLPIPIHSKIDDNGNVEYVGERHWLHARNASNATLFLFKHGTPGEHYNVVGKDCFKNDEIVKKIGDIMNKKPILEYVDFHKTRPGHDRRYALDGSKLKDMGWTPPMDFDMSLQKTIQWTLKRT